MRNDEEVWLGQLVCEQGPYVAVEIQPPIPTAGSGHYDERWFALRSAGAFAQESQFPAGPADEVPVGFVSPVMFGGKGKKAPRSMRGADDTQVVYVVAPGLKQSAEVSVQPGKPVPSSPGASGAHDGSAVAARRAIGRDANPVGFVGPEVTEDDAHGAEER